MLEQQPELKHLPRAVALFLAGYPEADPRNPEATLLENLPQLPNPMVRIRYCRLSGVSIGCTVGSLDHTLDARTQTRTTLMGHNMDGVPL